MANNKGNPNIAEYGKGTRFDSCSAVVANEKSNEAKKEKASLRNELLLMLEEENVCKNLAVSIIKKALDGNVSAWVAIRDTIGEKPTDKLEVATMDNEAITEFEQFVYGQKRDS